MGVGVVKLGVVCGCLLNIYIVEVVCEYVGVRLGGLNVFYGDEYGVQLCP